MITILIVDDDADIRALLRMSFQLAGGWRIIVADSVADAAHALESTSIDVILTDNQLGDGCAADVLAHAAGRPAVVVSASVDAPNSTLVPLAGYAGGISKPFNPMTLPALIASVVPSVATPP